MKAEEVIAARKALGLTPDELAATLGLNPNVIAAWEEGTLGVPKSFAEQLRYEAAAAELKAAIAGKGLEECAWDKPWQDEPLPGDLQAQSEHIERRATHAETCPVCRARGEYVAEKFRKMPRMPESTSMRMVGAVTARIDSLPRWAQPGVWTALGFGAYSVFRIIAFLPRLARQPQYWYVPLEGLAMSVSIGGAIGLIYGWIRELRNKR